MKPTAKTIAWATLVAGMLDILSAFLRSGEAGGNPIETLNAVASGPFGRQLSGLTGAVGLIVHFAVTTVMAAVIILALIAARSLKTSA